MNRALWIVQWLLALLFLFAGAAKWAMPIDEMARQASLSGEFLRFIGILEVLGGLGLVLPGLLRIQTRLTPLAAAGLVMIMIGATVVSVKIGPVSTAALPLVTGLLCAFVAYGRWRIVPLELKAATP